MSVTKKAWHILLCSFALTNALLIALFLGFLVYNRDSLPAQHFSGNVSVNEKIRWLKARGQNCDTLVIGSSMALNNVDFHELEAIGLRHITNAGAWSLGVPQTLRLLEILLASCKPATVIYPVYYGDFDQQDVGSDVDFDRVAAYVGRKDKGERLLDYLVEIDPYDLVGDFLKARKKAPLGRTVYDALQFDASGAVLLSSQNFHIKQRRWEGYRYNAIRVQEGSFSALREVADLARKSGIRLVVAETPLRAPSIPVLGRNSYLRWRERVREICERNGSLFIQAPAASDFDDFLFADYAHLNENGAQLWTRRLASVLRKAIPES